MLQEKPMKAKKRGFNKARSLYLPDEEWELLLKIADDEGHGSRSLSVRLWLDSKRKNKLDTSPPKQDIQV